MNDLRLAMRRADTAERFAQEAVATALTIPDDVIPDDELIRREEEAESRAKADAEAQRDLDAALADVIEVVARHRSRLGRRVCSSHDGGVVRKMFDLLRSMNGDAGESGFGA
jgi:hypothetical protein